MCDDDLTTGQLLLGIALGSILTIIFSVIARFLYLYWLQI